MCKIEGMIPKLQMHFLQAVERQQKLHISTDMLRLDMIHPIISGNKWFKLRYYLEKAVRDKQTRIVTAGGPFSNHLVAAAHFCKLHGIHSKGLVRGYANAPRTPSLLQAEQDGMELEFVSKKDFDSPHYLETHYVSDNDLWIPMGGQGDLGAEGFDILLKEYELKNYTHIICAVGTGTMMAGLLNICHKNQRVLGILAHNDAASVHDFLQKFINSRTILTPFILFDDYHEGGFAKKSPELLQTMVDVWRKYQIPLDFVYTAKMWKGYKHLLEQDFFEPQSKILLIHSGGLQGNLSLPPHALPY